MELNEEEKRQLFQVDGDCQAKVLDELYMTARFTRNPEQRDMVRGLMAKLRVLSDEQCMDLVKDIQKNYHLPYPPRTMGERIALARQQSGAEKLKGAVSLRSNMPKKYEARLLRRVGLRRIIEV